MNKTIKTLTIEGMTCGHCVARVEKALGGVDGVQKVKVDLSQSKATLEMSRDIDFRVLRDAVDDAGYTAAEEV